MKTSQTTPRVAAAIAGMALFLGAAVIIVPLFQRLGLGSVLGYLVAGVAIAPVLRWLGADAVQISHIAEFGVVMMLFLVGLELEPKKLWRNGGFYATGKNVRRR